MNRGISMIDYLDSQTVDEFNAVMEAGFIPPWVKEKIQHMTEEEIEKVAKYTEPRMQYSNMTPKELRDSIRKFPGRYANMIAGALSFSAQRAAQNNVAFNPAAETTPQHTIREGYYRAVFTYIKKYMSSKKFTVCDEHGNAMTNLNGDTITQNLDYDAARAVRTCMDDDHSRVNELGRTAYKKIYTLAPNFVNFASIDSNPVVRQLRHDTPVFNDLITKWYAGFYSKDVKLKQAGDMAELQLFYDTYGNRGENMKKFRSDLLMKQREGNITSAINNRNVRPNPYTAGDEKIPDAEHKQWNDPFREPEEDAPIVFDYEMEDDIKKRLLDELESKYDLNNMTDGQRKKFFEQLRDVDAKAKRMAAESYADSNARYMESEANRTHVNDIAADASIGEIFDRRYGLYLPHVTPLSRDMMYKKLYDEYVNAPGVDAAAAPRPLEQYRSYLGRTFRKNGESWHDFAQRLRFDVEAAFPPKYVEGGLHKKAKWFNTLFAEGDIIKKCNIDPTAQDVFGDWCIVHNDLFGEKCSPEPHPDHVSGFNFQNYATIQKMERERDAGYQADAEIYKKYIPTNIYA
ncbi:MAG: hypothetical protein MJZ25_08715 [Fibrobacter sp.]|nr:hypothetical protein [Fibrobacter sp.]